MTFKQRFAKFDNFLQYVEHTYMFNKFETIKKCNCYGTDRQISLWILKETFPRIRVLWKTEPKQVIKPKNAKKTSTIFAQPQLKKK